MPQQQEVPAKSDALPYANGLPSYYKLSLGFRMIRVCAAATASTSAVVITCSLLTPVLLLIPWTYIFSEIVFAIILWKRWHRFNKMRHDAHSGVVAVAATRSSAINMAAMQERFEAVLSSLKRGGPAEVEAFLELWFHDKPVSDIGRGNLLELISYAFFYIESSAAIAAQGHAAILESMADRLEDLLLHPGASTPAIATNNNTRKRSNKQDQDEELRQVQRRLEEHHDQQQAQGGRLAPGTNPAARFMAHMTEPLPHFYRPLAFYAGMEAMCWVNHCMLLAAGYQRIYIHSHDASTTTAEYGKDVGKQDGSFSEDYYYYVANMPAAATQGPQASQQGQDGTNECGDVDGGFENVMKAKAGGKEQQQKEPPVPIVFLHGVGMGLMPYLRLLVALAATGAPVIAFELKHVSQRWTSTHPPSMQELAAEVVAALSRHGCRQAAVLAHSFGTAVASVLLQSYPGVVRHVTMMDPVCFRMYIPRLLRNFIYRRLGAAGTAATAWAALEAAEVAAAASAATTPTTSTTAPEVPVPSFASSASLPSSPKSDEVAESSFLPQDCLPASGAAETIETSVVTISNAAGTTAIASNSAGRMWDGLAHLCRVAVGLPLDLLMLGPARELHCTALLCRRLVWSDINLWEHMVPEWCTVVLSGRDDLTCTRSLQRWLQNHTPATVVLHPELFHAQICVAWTRQDQVLDDMLRKVYGSGGGITAKVASTATMAVAAPSLTMAPVLSSGGASPIVEADDIWCI